MEKEGKSRRICLGGRVYSIPCRASYFALDDFNYRMNCTFSSKLTEAKQLAQQVSEQILPPKQMRRLLPLLLSPSLCIIWADYYLVLIYGTGVRATNRCEPRRLVTLSFQDPAFSSADTA